MSSTSQASLGRDTLIESQLATVETIVNCIWRRKPVAGMEKGDLISEGYIGLVKAADSFDEKRGASFSTHAILCIRHALCNALKSAGVRRAEEVVQESLQDEAVGTPDTTSHSDAKLMLEAALPQLPIKTRQAIQLVELDGLSKVEAARRLNITERHVARLIAFGMAELRTILN